MSSINSNFNNSNNNNNTSNSVVNNSNNIRKNENNNLDNEFNDIPLSNINSNSINNNSSSNIMGYNNSNNNNSILSPQQQNDRQQTDLANSISDEDSNSVTPQTSSLDEDTFEINSGFTNGGVGNSGSGGNHHLYYQNYNYDGGGPTGIGTFRRRHSSGYEKHSTVRRSMNPGLSTVSSSSSSSSSRSPSPSLYSAGGTDMQPTINGFDLNTMSPTLGSQMFPSANQFIRHKQQTVPSLSIPTTSFSAPASSSSTPTPISPNTSTFTSYSYNNNSNNNNNSSNTINNSSIKNNNGNNNNSKSKQTSSASSPLSSLSIIANQSIYEKVLHIFHFILSAILAFNIFILVSKHFFSKIYQWSGEGNSLNNILIFIYPLHLVFAAMLFFLLVLQTKVRSLFFDSKSLRYSIHGEIIKKLEKLNSRAQSKHNRHQSSSSSSTSIPLPEVIELFESRSPYSTFFSQTLDYILLGVAFSGLVNLVLIHTYFNPNDEQVYHDSIFNICSSIEFLVAGFVFNFSGYKESVKSSNNESNHHQQQQQQQQQQRNSSNNQQQQQQQPQSQQQQLLNYIFQSSTPIGVLRSFIAKIYLCLSLVFILLVARTYYEPLSKIIPTFNRGGVDDISFYSFQSPILVIIYFLQVVLLFFEYYEQSSYRLATFILATVFVWLTTFNSYHLTVKLFETFNLEKLILRRWIRCISTGFPCVGLALDYYLDWKQINFKYNQVLCHVDNILQSDLHLHDKIDSYKKKIYNTNLFLTSTINQYKRIISSANPMVGFLNDTDIQPHQAPYLHKISKSFEQLTSMSKECLFYSELKSLGPSDCERTTFNMETLLEEVISNPTVRSFFEEKELDLCYLLSPNIPLHLIGDSHKLKNILLRLLNNSLKATYQGEIVIRVTLLTEPKQNEDMIISFSVIDTGCGIDIDNVPFLFEPYAMSQYGYDGESLGLGLSICKQLAVLMGGDINYSNNIPEGSVFTLCLPFGSQSLFRPHSNPSYKWGTGHKVLIIDDNSNITSAVEMHLDPLGFTVIKAHSINQGISIIKNSKDLSLIFLDSMLPGLNIDEIKQLKFDPTKTIKNPPLVLMCTNKQRKTYSNQGLHFLFKPIKKEQLLTITHSIATSPQSNVYTLQPPNYSINTSPNTMSSSLQTTKSNSTPSTPLSKQSSLPSKLLYSRNSGSQIPNRHISQISSSSSSASTSTPPSPQTKITLSSAPNIAGNLSSSGSFFSPITPSQSPSSSPITSPILRANNNSNTLNESSTLPLPASELSNSTSPLDNNIFNSNLEQQGSLIPSSISSSGGVGDEENMMSDPLEFSPNTVSPSQSPKIDPYNRHLVSVTEGSESDSGLAMQASSLPQPPPNVPSQKITPETLTPTITHKQEFIEQKQNQSQQTPSVPPQQSSSNTAATSASSANNNINILLVEDNPVNARIATTVLQKHSFKVELTSNGQLALDRIKASHGSFDLILMDIHMPVMDGITCARMIRKFEGEHTLKKIPIIALTADTSVGHKNVCLEAGCNEFMPKPLDYPILINVLKKLLDTSEEVAIDSNSAILLAATNSNSSSTNSALIVNSSSNVK